MDVNNLSGERNEEVRSAWREAVYNPFSCWSLARSQQRRMIQVLFTILALGGCVVIVGVLPLDERLPMYFRALIVFCALITVLFLAYLTVQQAWPCLQAWIRRRANNRTTEEAIPLSGQASARPEEQTSAQRSNSFVYQAPATPMPLPESPPPYQPTSSPPRYSALPNYPLGPQPHPRPYIYMPTPPPPFPIPPIPLGYPSLATASAYNPNTSSTSLETAIRNCYLYDQGWEPLTMGSGEPSPASSVGGEDEHSNSDTEQEHAV